MATLKDSKSLCTLLGTLNFCSSRSVKCSVLLKVFFFILLVNS